jgi:hypothetical protein
MTLGVGNIVALVCIVISVVFAVVTNLRPLTHFGGRCWRFLRSCGGT